MLSGTRYLRRGVKAAVGNLQARLHTWGVLPSRGLVFPDFLGIGAQKAGTTWLYANLRCHPDVFLPRKKELHYFDWHFHRSLRSYSRRFEPGLGKVKGEITPAYIALPPGRIRYVHRLMPEARLIFLMRHPVDRAWSQALMNLVVRRKRRVEDVSDDEFLDHFAMDGAVRRGDYAGGIDNWLALYPREQLYVALFEDISERPQQLLTDVFEHIGVTTQVDWSAFPYSRIVHKGVGAPIPDRHREYLHRLYRDDIERLVERYGERVAHWRDA